MSLYDGLDIDDKPGAGKESKKPDVSGWGSSLKLLETQKQLQAKKASLLNVKSRKPQGTTLAPVINLKKRGGNASGGSGPNDNNAGVRFNLQTGRMERPAGAAANVSQGSPFIANEAPSFLGVTDEYDPLHPNDYEDVVARRREQRQREREEERRREAEERNKRRKEPPAGSDSDSDDEFERRRRRREAEKEEEEKEEKPRRPVGAGAAIAPPASLIEEDKPPGPPEQENRQESLLNFSLARGSVASKIMARMGYREGQGLGKSEQGMSTALQVEKTSKRGGKIIHEKDIPKVTEPPRAEVSNANVLKNPSKVILLLNMVGPGEVDEDLEPETAEECQKYGKVIKCVIFEIPGVSDDEAVRIFVEFERMEAAIKAVVDLNGRYFGGRTVRGGFYNLDKFRRLDLADPVE